MPTVNVVNMQGQNVGQMTLSDDLFACEVNVPAMHMVVRSILANKRQGTQSALTRSMVRGGGRKIYRQKGTGNARHHGNRAPQFRHGGVVFAPQPRDYVVKVQKKLRRLALKSALTSKLNAGELIVVDEIKFEQPKTKLAAAMMKAIGVEKTALVVLPGRDESVIRPMKNLPGVIDTYVGTLNVYDILRAGKLVLTKAAVQGIEEVYAS